MRAYTDEIAVKGKRIKVQGIKADNHEIVVIGRLFKTARIKEEWDEDVEDPASLIAKLRSSGVRIDIFTFMQRLPESRPKYDYSMEWDNVAAIPIKDYEYWFDKQLHPNHRNKVKKANRQGVQVNVVDFDDNLVSSIMGILNEVPFRQGGPFLDCGKDFETVKREHATYLERADFIGAYYKGKLIGYIKLVFAGRFMRTMQVLSMMRHRDKAPTNALVAEAVKLCCERRIPFLVYGKYSYGKVGSQTLKDFKDQNGFEHVLLPRYYVPLTPLGRVALACRLHRGIVRGIVPEKLIRFLLSVRRKWYAGMAGRKLP